MSGSATLEIIQHGAARSDGTPAVEHRWVEGQYKQVPATAAELVRRQVAVIVAKSLPPLLVSLQLRSRLPDLHSRLPGGARSLSCHK